MPASEPTFAAADLVGVPSPQTLRRLGWNAWLDVAIADVPAPSPDAWLGRIVGDYGVEVEVDNGAGVRRAVSGTRRTNSSTDLTDVPVTGDWAWCCDLEDGRARVVQLLPRRHLVRRRAAGTPDRPQHLVAHVDQLVIVCSLQRDLNVRRIERYLVLADDAGAAPVVVLTKRDVTPNWEELTAPIVARLGEVPVLALSVFSGDGVDTLRALLFRWGTVALLGSSGAGKSTLVNALLGEERQSTSAVSTRDHRGRHTTTARRLLWVDSLQTSLVDTPGLREVEPWVDAERAREAFGDLFHLASGCRFRDCSHRSEPDCAVHAAVARGVLDGARVRAFQRLDAELRERDAIREGGRIRRR